jgi:hypothetical protein
MSSISFEAKGTSRLLMKIFSSRTLSKRSVKLNYESD